MAGMGHLAAVPAIPIRHNEMVPYVPEKFYFADVRPKEAEKLRERPDSHPNPPFFRKHRRNKLKWEPGPWFSGKIVRQSWRSGGCNNPAFELRFLREMYFGV
jgi:hypothetical protein